MRRRQHNKRADRLVAKRMWCIKFSIRFAKLFGTDKLRYGGEIALDNAGS